MSHTSNKLSREGTIEEITKRILEDDYFEVLNHRVLSNHGYSFFLSKKMLRIYTSTIISSIVLIQREQFVDIYIDVFSPVQSGNLSDFNAMKNVNKKIEHLCLD